MKTVTLLRSTLLQMARVEWNEFWIAAPRLDAGGVALLLPFLRAQGKRVRVLTCLTPEGLADHSSDPLAVARLMELPDCEVRLISALDSSLYLCTPNGSALVTGAALRLAELESGHGLGVLTTESGDAAAVFKEWWEQAAPLTSTVWQQMLELSTQVRAARSVAEQIKHLGAFVRVSVRGTRRSRRLDPRDFGAAEEDWGRLVRPVEVALYKLDEVIRAKEDLESLLAEKGLEWNGHYLVPRFFLDREWPRIFADRERLLRERLGSPEGRAALNAQLGHARRELEAFFGDLFVRVKTHGIERLDWIEQMTAKVVDEAMADSVLGESGLEYRVLRILPEDARSVEEIGRLLQDPKLRSVQLTFDW